MAHIPHGDQPTLEPGKDPNRPPLTPAEPHQDLPGRKDDDKNDKPDTKPEPRPTTGRR